MPINRQVARYIPRADLLLMKITFLQILISLSSLLLAVVTIVFLSQSPAQFGSEPLLVRALVFNFAIVATLVAIYPVNPFFDSGPRIYGIVVCLPAVIPAFIYFLYLLPKQAGEGITAEQLQSQLITDSSSNGIIEVGFRYPIYTPTISVKNQELFTKQANIFFRMTDANGNNALFRGVRSQIPNSGLSVEATVQGMLSNNSGYLFNPLRLPPNRDVSGRVVFIISNLEDGTNFTEALGKASQVQFELRDPENGQLLLEFPLNRI